MPSEHQHRIQRNSLLSPATEALRALSNEHCPRKYLRLVSPNLATSFVFEGSIAFRRVPQNRSRLSNAKNRLSIWGVKRSRSRYQPTKERKENKKERIANESRCVRGPSGSPGADDRSESHVTAMHAPTRCATKHFANKSVTRGPQHVTARRQSVVNKASAGKLTRRWRHRNTQAN